MRRRALVALAVVALLAAGAVTAVVVHRMHQVADVRGSSTVEFTAAATTEPKPAPHVDWPLYGYGTARTRSVPYPLKPPFKTVWRYHAGSLVEFPPSVGYGRLFFSTNSGKFVSISIKDGRRAWKYISHRCVAASPAVGPYGSVYAVFLNKPPCNRSPGTPGLQGLVIDFGVGWGKVRWTQTIGPTESSPLQVAKTLYLGDWNGDVWALDHHTGRKLWRFHTNGAVKGGVAYAGGRLYVGSYDGHVYSLTLAGKEIWRASSLGTLLGTGRFYSTPAVAYGRVYIGATDGKVYSFGAGSGKLRWARDTGGYVYASPAVAHDTVYVGSYSHWFTAFDAATGATRWRFQANGPISGSATVVGNVVYFATLSGRTYALDATTGKQVWTFPDGEYTPVVAIPGMLFLVGQATVYGMVPR